MHGTATFIKAAAAQAFPGRRILQEAMKKTTKIDADKIPQKLSEGRGYGQSLRIPSSSYYKNEALLTDIVNILDWLTDNCYYPRSETDNWWNWEIGMPKNVLPAVLYIYDDIPKEQSRKFVKGVEFFMPDPFHLAVLGTASTSFRLCACRQRKPDGLRLHIRRPWPGV